MNTVPVLVIIRDQDSRALAVEVLEYIGFPVTKAGTAGDGLRMVRQHLPCAIVLDVFGLEDFDGLQLMRVLQNHPATREIPIIGTASRYDWDEIENAGFAALIDDPVEVDELSTAITAALGDTSLAVQNCG